MGKYDDMLYLPHHVSAKHPHMSLYDRAAQFSPFAALSGYDAAIIEAARLTGRRIELSEEEKIAVDDRLRYLAKYLPHQPESKITYFVPDKKKDGGAYQTIEGIVKRIDDIQQRILMIDGTVIPIKYILDIEGAVFSEENFD